MPVDLLCLQRELDRLLGRVLDFGSFRGWRVEHVPRSYLLWCVQSVPLRPELRRSILKVLSRPIPVKP